MWNYVDVKKDVYANPGMSALWQASSIEQKA
jgi:hypothetical protein